MMFAGVISWPWCIECNAGDLPGYGSRELFFLMKNIHREPPQCLGQESVIKKYWGWSGGGGGGGWRWFIGWNIRLSIGMTMV